MCLVVPTAQAGRRLQEAVAQLAAQENAAVLGLRTVTPAHFIKTTDPAIADESIELIAWMEVLESIGDWSELAAAFPQPLGDDEAPGWSLALAQSLADLRYQLQENGLLIRDAAQRMGLHHDAPRWLALTLLETRVEALLRSWSLCSRSEVLQQRQSEQTATPLPNDCSQLVVVGVTETSPFVAQQWLRTSKVRVLIGAPESESEQFNEFGFPTTAWCERMLGFPGRLGIDGGLHLAADIRQLAEQAVDCSARKSAASNQIILATCDPTLGQPLVTAFSRAGWSVFDPSSPSAALDWRVWLQHWLRWLVSPRLSVIAEMAGFRETQCLTGGNSYGWLRSLGILRDQSLVETLEDIERIATHDPLPRGLDAEKLQRLIDAVRNLLRWRGEFLKLGFCATMKKLLERWQSESLIDAVAMEQFSSLLACWQPWEKRLSRDASFWLQLCCDRLPVAALELPNERALDVEGWLEIPFHEAPHLLICGMDDQMIPARCGGEPWLSATSRERLGLNIDAQREARDAYLYHALLESHRGQGRIDIFFSKTDTQGKILRPSRLLLRAQGEELAQRVALLFDEVPPVDSQLHWQADWKWQPRLVATEINKLSVTALRDYLACPYRFYLKHVIGMNHRDGERGEWNSRDFGNILHEVLEHWGGDPVAKELSSAKALIEHWHVLLDQRITYHYGSHLNLALQIQKAAMQQRLEWLAEIQAERRVEGWQILAVEKPFELMLANITLKGKIDRIDHHPASDTYMMWDYKTGKSAGKVAAAHLKNFGAKSTLPKHLANEECMILTDAKGKQQQWVNLQLPLYAAAGITPNIPGVGYISVGDSRDQVVFEPWQNFDESIANAARNCAKILVQHIAAKIFWPPNEKTKYDDFRALEAGADLTALTEFVGSLKS